MKYISCWYYADIISSPLGICLREPRSDSGIIQNSGLELRPFSDENLYLTEEHLKKHLIHIYGKNTCRWKVSLWRQIWWNRWPLKRKQQGHRHISHNHHHSPLFEILVEQGIQRSSDHSRRRGPVFGENEVSQIFWERDKVSKQTLNSNYRSIKQYEKLLRGKINEVVRRTNTYFLSELITESTPTVPMNGMADGWMGTNKNGGKSDLGELTDSGRGKGKCS